MQGKDRKALNYLSRWDYILEQRGIRTIRGDDNRRIIKDRNKEREREISYERNR
jgi:hypothetical protein